MSDMIDRAAARKVARSLFRLQTSGLYGAAGVSGYGNLTDVADAAIAALPTAQPDAPDLMQPATVHLNMLRGTIAKPTVEQIIHLYGVDALVKALAPVIVREADHEPS